MKFVTNYMDEAVFNLPAVISHATEALVDVEFDTLVGTGFSGGVVIPALALALGKNFVLIRKEEDDSHHGGGRLLGNLGARWIFVDDFVSGGGTKRRVLDKIELACREQGEASTYIGDYLYVDPSEQGPHFEPAEVEVIVELPEPVEEISVDYVAPSNWTNLGYTTEDGVDMGVFARADAVIDYRG